MRKLGTFVVVVAALVVASSALAQKQGKVLMYVSAAEAGVYKGHQQRTPDLEESAKDIRRHLGRSKWIKVTSDVEEADVKVTVLGRRDDPDKGIAIGYELDAGAYKTEDEFFDNSQSATVMGGASREARDMTNPSAHKSVADYEDIAAQFADSLSYFCEQNYERIVSQRE